MKFWLIVFFLNSHGDLVGKREILYEDEAKCYIAMDNIRAPRKNLTIQMDCIPSDQP